MTNQTQRPQLEAPGAGISRTEMLLLNKVLKRFLIKNSGVTEAVSFLKKSKAEILAAVEVVDKSKLTEKVLVARPWFVEDSSRNWSVAMLCRHLAIVDSSLARAIESGRVVSSVGLPEPSKRVAAVKPEEEKNQASVIDEFSDAVVSLAAAADKHKPADLKVRTIPHPWLGEISHLQWIWFAGYHHRVHLKQLQAIVRGLKWKN